MAVHRIGDRAELLLQRLAAAEHKKPAQFLNDLITDYAAGLTFEKDPDLDGLQTRSPDGTSAADSDVETGDQP